MTCNKKHSLNFAGSQTAINERKRSFDLIYEHINLYDIHLKEFSNFKQYHKHFNQVNNRQMR